MCWKLELASNPVAEIATYKRQMAGFMELLLAEALLVW